MHLLCVAIDLKQSVEGTLKVWGKYLTTVFDEVHFVVNLYSFPLPLVPQANPFFPQGTSFVPFQGRTTSKTTPSFSVNPSIFEDMSSPRLESTKW